MGEGLQAGERLRTKCFQPLRPAMLCHLRIFHILRILFIPQSCLANPMGPLGSVLNVTSSRKPSLIISHHSGLAALALLSVASSRFLSFLFFNCLSHSSKWAISSMRAGLMFIFVTTLSPEPETVLDECVWNDCMRKEMVAGCPRESWYVLPGLPYPCC